MSAYMWLDNVMTWLPGTAIGIGLWVGLMLFIARHERRRNKRHWPVHPAEAAALRGEMLNGEFIDAPDHDCRKVRR